MDSVGKYSVQNWDIYRLESGVTTPRRGGVPPAGLGRLWDDDYVFLPYYAVCGVKTVKVMGGWRLYL